jgi:hypothetical protein
MMRNICCAVALKASIRTSVLFFTLRSLVLAKEFIFIDPAKAITEFVLGRTCLYTLVTSHAVTQSQVNIHG